MAITPTTVERDLGNRASWGAIFAGTVLSLALIVLMGLLGLGFGFSAIDPAQQDIVGGADTGTPIWLFVSQIIALFIGGFAAARLAGHLGKPGALLHGATIWSLQTLIAVYLAGALAVTGVQSVGSMLNTAGSAISTTADAVIPDDMSLPDISLPNMTFDSLPDEVQDELRAEGITPENFRAEARAAFRNIISESEQRRAIDRAEATAGEILRNPGTAREEIEDFLDTLYGGSGAILNEEDKEEAIEVMESRFGISPADARQFLDTIEARAQELQTQMEQTVETMQAEAVDAAQAATDAAATTAFYAFLASLLGLIAAMGGALVGRPSPY